MLQNDLYTFTDIRTEENTLRATVQLNPSHAIFKGHFPGEPVLPGVCMTQMVKELLENHIGKQTRLLKALDIKFLSIITPQQDKSILLELKLLLIDDTIRVDAKLLNDGSPLFKFKGFFER